MKGLKKPEKSIKLKIYRQLKWPYKGGLFQSTQPVLTGVDADSTYCFLLEAVEHRDEDTWGYYLLEAEEQGLNPDYTIADAGKGLRAGQKAAWGDIPCHGDVWHIFDQCTTLCSNLAKKAQGATTQREELQQKMELAKLKGEGNKLSAKLRTFSISPGNSLLGGGKNPQASCVDFLDQTFQLKRETGKMISYGHKINQAS